MASGTVFRLNSLLQALPQSSCQISTSQSSTRLFSTSTTLYMKRKGVRVKNQKKDPYREAQALQRKTANLAKRKILQEQRQAALGDPVLSRPTPFISSLSSGQSKTVSGDNMLNYDLVESARDEQIEHSRWLTEPLPSVDGKIPVSEEEPLAERRKEHQLKHEAAKAAIDRITSASAISGATRQRINVRKCIEEFGRHNTDATLKTVQKASTLYNENGDLTTLQEASLAEFAGTKTEAQIAQMREELVDANKAQYWQAQLEAIPKRAGPDTGSSEVQIAILTAKINTMAQNVHKKDKHNKRKLRLWVHRRQKLLKYLRHQDRGGSRWQLVVDQLGINDAMWKGEISL